ncbi:hypothetical protein GJQ55_02560 [Venatoribacter cucullus]|uniref:Uncharacterized protein n=1 Tax=Venatoribacter cucullus TaxID=2661630 RepID=A0A9X7YN97_9GAMM|nr:hypothetical protein [Venatoribacter cucullus]QQD23431.1 hypothetical protein GJQ55_02560 [Venatoribacter cucullus]
MDKDKEPLLSDMKPSQEDIALRQKQLQARKAAAARAAAGSSPAKQPAGAKPSQTLAISALVLGVLLAGLAGWLFTQVQAQQQQLLNAEKLLRSQAQNIEVLNERLSVTGENANLSVDALKTIVKEHDSEIRKLWDLANKRNRADIGMNSKAIAGVKTELSKTDKELRAGLEQQKKQLASSDSAAQSREAELKKRLQKAEAQLVSLSGTELRLVQQGETIQALENEIARMKKAGIGADAADIRLQLEDVNIRLDRMQNAIGPR